MNKHYAIKSVKLMTIAAIHFVFSHQPKTK